MTWLAPAGAFGDYHNSENKFVFGSPKLSGSGEEALSRYFMRYLLGFGRSGGDPNAPRPGQPSGGGATSNVIKSLLACI